MSRTGSAEVASLSQNQPPESAIVLGLAKRLPFFYGWVIIAISFLCVFMMGATSFWAAPIFVDPMSDDTGWKHSVIFLGLSVRFIVNATGGLLLGHITDRRGGASKLLLFGVLIDAAALLSIRFVDSPVQFILLYGVVGGIGSTGVRLIQSTLIAKWFVARRGTAVGFAANGGGFSAIIMAPITSMLISDLGWRDAWGVLGVLSLVLLLPLVPFAVRAPEDMGLEPDNGPRVGRAVRSAATERSYALKDVVNTWQFRLLLIGVLVGNYSLQTHTVIMVPYFTDDLGFSSETAAASLSMYGVFSMGMRFLWGALADRTSVRIAIMFQAVLTGIGALLLMQVSSTFSLYAIMAYQGMMLSGFPPLQILVWPEFFGREHIGSIVGMTSFFSTVAGAAGPVIAGFLFDQTGSYNAGLWMLVGTWAVCTMVMFTVKPAQRGEDRVPAGATQT